MFGESRKGVEEEALREEGGQCERREGGGRWEMWGGG